MKTSLLAVLLLVICQSSFAQKWELSLNAGFNYNTIPVVEGSIPFWTRGIRSAPPATTLSVKFMRNFKHDWQVGISVDTRQLSFMFLPGIDPMEDGFSYVKVMVADPAIPVKIFANKKLKFKSIETYGGISAGYVFADIRPGSIAPTTMQTDHDTRGTGFDIGMQAGGNYFISKHIAINAEIGMDYMKVSTSTYSWRLFSFPSTIGIRYRF